MIVVTGAAGFIGSNVVAALNERCQTDIAVCDWLGQDQRWMNLRKRMFRHFVFPEDLMGFLDGGSKVEAIIHMGANSATTATDGDSIVRANLQFSLKLLDWCTQHRVPLVYASSAATYGDGSEGFDDGLSLPALRRLRPLNLYGWSKHQFDLILAECVELGLALPPKCIGLKFCNVFGQNEYHKGDMMSVPAKNYDTAAGGGEVKLFKSHHNDYVDGGLHPDARDAARQIPIFHRGAARQPAGCRLPAPVHADARSSRGLRALSRERRPPSLTAKGYPQKIDPVSVALRSRLG